MCAYSRRDFLCQNSIGIAALFTTDPAQAAPQEGSALGQKLNASIETLQETKVKPRDVVQARWVLNPRGPLNGGWAVVDSREGEGSLVFDFGEEVVGRVFISGKCGSHSELSLFYGEDLVEALTTTDLFPVTRWYRLPGGSLDRWVLTNYCTDLISAFREYHDFTGDGEPVQNSWARLVRLIAFFCKKVNLADAVAQRNFITDMQPEVAQWWGSRGALAMQLCCAMRDGAELARRQRDKGTEMLCRDYLTQNAEVYREEFWCSRRLVFRNEAQPDADTGWHVNALAILSGIVPDRASASELLKRVAALPDVRQTYCGFMEFYKLQALWRAGLSHLALDECLSYWGHMLKYDATTTWENCNRSLDGILRKPGAPTSQCHGWSAGPAYLFPAFILGVQPEGAGFARVRLTPQLGDLAWAEGTVPTPKGEIFAHWEAGPPLHGFVELPTGLSGSVEIDGQRFDLQPCKNQVPG